MAFCHKSHVQRQAILLFAAILALLAFRLRPPDFTHLAKTGNCVTDGAAHDKKQVLEKSGTDFAAPATWAPVAPSVVRFTIHSWL